jgi:hypothetical protein
MEDLGRLPFSGCLFRMEDSGGSPFPIRGGSPFPIHCPTPFHCLRFRFTVWKPLPLFAALTPHRARIRPRPQSASTGE